MKKPFRLVAGVDEVGRGPLAGAVVAAAVILDPNRWIDGLADSKTLCERKRIELDMEIRNNAYAWAIGRAEVDEIDAINILQASLLAMQRAVESLPVAPQHLKIDGNKCLDSRYIKCSMEAIVKGDSKVAAISAASIIAKVARDREMMELDRRYPQYGFAEHKGYATRKHREALIKFGATEIHRTSFKPVRLVMERR